MQLAFLNFSPASRHSRDPEIPLPALSSPVSRTPRPLPPPVPLGSRPPTDKVFDSSGPNKEMNTGFCQTEELGTLRSDEGDGNGNATKAIGLIS